MTGTPESVDRSKGDPNISPEGKEILRKVAFDENFIDELQGGVANDPAFNADLDPYANN